MPQTMRAPARPSAGRPRRRCPPRRPRPHSGSSKPLRRLPRVSAISTPDHGRCPMRERRAEVRAALHALAPAESVAGYDDDVKALSRKIDLIAANGPDAETLQHLEAAIVELRAVSARVASGDALAALAGEVRTIGAKLDHYSSAEPRDGDGGALIVRRIDALAAALEARGGGAAPLDTS